VNALETILAEVRQVLERMDDGQLERLAAGLLAAPRVFVTGEGRSGFMAKAFAMRLAHLGLPVAVLGETTTPPVTRVTPWWRSRARAPPTGPSTPPGRPPTRAPGSSP
jgi:D-arabinose 5-phosphate isomerase GutQ